MSHDRGVRAQRWVAAFLQTWWPLAEAVGSGRRGSDVLNTPGISWEVKTANDFKPTQFVKQAAANCGANLPIVVYIPNGTGEMTVQNSLAIVPLHLMAGLLEDAGYTPNREVAEV